MKSKLKKSLAFLFAFIMVFTMIGVQLPAIANAATKIAFSCTKKTVAIGGTYTLTVEGVNDKKATYAWSSSDKKIATVSNKGVVTGVAEGTATIKCKITMSDKSAKTLSCKITVLEQKPATSIRISNAKLDANNVHTLVVGETYNFNRKLSPSTSNDKTYWYIQDEEYAEVDSSGVVTAKKAGTTMLIAKVGIDRVSAEDPANKVVASVCLNIVPVEKQEGEWYTKFLSGELLATGNIIKDSERSFFVGNIHDLSLKLSYTEGLKSVLYGICDMDKDKVPELLLHFVGEIDLEQVGPCRDFYCSHEGCIKVSDAYCGIKWNGKEAVIIYYNECIYNDCIQDVNVDFYENGLIYTRSANYYEEGSSNEHTIELVSEKESTNVREKYLVTSSWEPTIIKYSKLWYPDLETSVSKIYCIGDKIVNSIVTQKEEITQEEASKLLNERMSELNVNGIAIKKVKKELNVTITASPINWYDLDNWNW